jgi:ParB family chromosome partitioning protein
MPKSESKADTKKSVMDILMGDDTAIQVENNANSTVMLEINKLIPYPDHPFKLYECARLDDMVRSIKELGIIVPIIVRSRLDEDNTYEILSGHNRVNAAKIAGLNAIPAIVKEGLTDDDAALIVTETNLIQRSFADLTHSQRAIALKHHLDAIKSQGKRNDLLDEIGMLTNPDEIIGKGTSGLLGHRKKSRDKIAEKYGLDARTVSRYTRIASLINELLTRVDDEEIGLYPAVSISYLSKDEQEELNMLLNSEESTFKINMKKAEALRELSENGKLTSDVMLQVLSGEYNKKPKLKTSQPFKLKAKIYQKYFKNDPPKKEIESTITQALEEYFANHPELNK